MNIAPSSHRWTAWFWLPPALLGGAITVLLMVVLPPDRTLHGLGDWLGKVSPLVCAVLAIALFPRRNALALMAAGFAVYMGAVDTASFLHVNGWLNAALAGQGHAGFAAYYRFSLFDNAFVVLFALLAYRLGGASTAHVLKLGACGILALVSGLNDVTMWLLYPWPHGSRPTDFAWASHVTVFLGHTPHLVDMLGFLAIHVVLVGVILWLPLHRWFDDAASRRAPTALSAQPQAPPH